MGLESLVDGFEKHEIADYLYREDYDDFIKDYLLANSKQERKKVREKIIERIFKNVPNSLYNHSKYNTEMFNVLDKTIQKIIVELVKKPTIANKFEDDLNKKEKLTNFVKRKNGVNSVTTHYFAALESLVSSNVSSKAWIPTLLHDFLEDKRDLYKIQEKKFLVKEELKDLSKLLTFDKNYNNLILNSVQRMTLAEDKDYRVYAANLITIHSKYKKSDLPPSKQEEKKQAIDEVLITLIAKIGGDRVHNTLTMRPNETKSKELRESVGYNINLNEDFDEDTIWNFLNQMTDQREELEGKVGNLDNSPLYKTVYEKDMSAYFEDTTKFQEEFRKLHDAYHEIADFNTTSHRFIISNLYKNMILLSYSNKFLKETVLKGGLNASDDLTRNLLKKCEELAKHSKEQALIQVKHGLNFHSPHHLVFNDIYDARHNRDFSRLTPLKGDQKNTFSDGQVEVWFEGALYKKEEIVPQLNEKWSNDTDNLKFNLYLNLYHIFDNFIENPLHNYKEFKEKGNLELPYKTGDIKNGN